MKKSTPTCTRFALPLLLALAGVGGCSSIQVHNTDWGHPYGGTEKAVRNLRCGLFMSSIAFFLPAPFLLADVPLSFVIDTLLLPADVIITPQSSRDGLTAGYTYRGCEEGRLN